MNEDLKPCPFCGQPPEYRDEVKFSNGEIMTATVRCKNCGAVRKPKQWNSRPIEDALTAERDTALQEADNLKALSEFHLKESQELRRILNEHMPHLRKSLNERIIQLSAVMTLAEGTYKPGDIIQGDPRWTCAYDAVSKLLSKSIGRQGYIDYLKRSLEDVRSYIRDDQIGTARELLDILIDSDLMAVEE